MVQPISSAEKFGSATLGAGERQRHTEPEHQQCAYYVDVDFFEHPVMVCPDGEVAGGAFYSEDFLWEIRTTSHQLITTLLTMNLTSEQFRQIRNELHRLELLTK